MHCCAKCLSCNSTCLTTANVLYHSQNSTFPVLYRYRKCQGNFLFEFLTHFLYLHISPFQIISSFTGNATSKYVKEYFVHISGTFPALVYATFPSNFFSCRERLITWYSIGTGNVKEIFWFTFLTHFLYLYISLFHLISSCAGNSTTKYFSRISFVHISGTFSVLVHTTFPGDFQLCRKCQGNFFFTFLVHFLY